jgi:16S rRNA G527 N7-methylase RsmG
MARPVAPVMKAVAFLQSFVKTLALSNGSRNPTRAEVFTASRQGEI